ncbi:MAG: DUF1330 domain-containing protein [Bacteroidetes bacterium]|nr:DUF1330 domain-containing protein [Bacteroidota bacterium]
MAKLIVTAQLNPNGSEALSKYLEGMKALNEKAQAKPLAKYEINETIIGSSKLSYVAVMEFPDEASIHQLFASDEYQKLLKFRDQAFIRVDAFISK